MREEVKDFYSWFSAIYDRFLKLWNVVFAAPAEAKFDELFARHIGDDAEILEIGPGTGQNIQRLLRHKINFKSYHGIDLTPEMLAKAGQKYGHMENISLAQGDIVDIELTKTYDAVISTWVFSHLEEPEKTVEKLLASLNPGGVLLVMFLSRPAGGFLSRAVTSFFMRLFKADYVTQESIANFPPATENYEFPCFGGAASIYLLKK